MVLVFTWTVALCFYKGFTVSISTPWLCLLGSGDHRDLLVLTHSFPTRRSSDLCRLGRDGAPKAKPASALLSASASPSIPRHPGRCGSAHCRWTDLSSQPERRPSRPDFRPPVL